MNRKHFLSSVAVFAAGTQVFATERKYEEDKKIKVPQYLSPGDTIGITCPAGYIEKEEILPAKIKLEEWGFRVLLGKTVGKKNFSFGGTDLERQADIEFMLANPEVKAILFARGGYGAVRIIDKINFDNLIRMPKWLLGFSDITVLLCHIHQNFGIAGIHSKMCNSFPSDWQNAEPEQIETIESIRDCITGKKMQYNFSPNTFNKSGDAVGQLIGGNLRTIETLAGTKSDIKTDGKILFLEDTGEYTYSIDRMFWNLKRTGKLENLAGLIIGGMKIKKDNDEEFFGKTIEEIVLEKVENYKFPVSFGFPVGHQKNNFALKCGIPHRLIVEDCECTLSEI